MAQKAGINVGEAKPQRDTLSLSGLELIGPQGTRSYVRSLRHFLRRDEFPLTIREGKHTQAAPPNQEELSSKKRINKKKRKRQDNNENQKGNPDDKKTEEQSYFGVQSIPIGYQIPNQNTSRQVLSFVFTTPPVSGKFLIDSHSFENITG